MAARPRRKALSTEDLRKDLAGRLPGRLRGLLAEYEAFTGTPAPPEDAKSYAAHHAACKAALQHADMLVKLLRWAEGAPDAAEAGGEGGDELSRLLARARQAVSDCEGEEDDDST